jgi:SPP1 family predicted phage head-tail adaptor
VTGPGDLNRRLVLEAPGETDDGQGGVIRAYAAVTTLWAKVTPLAAHAQTLAERLGAAVTHRIVIRAGLALTTFHRFRDGARVFDVIAIRDSADRRFVEIEAAERQD